MEGPEVDGEVAYEWMEGGFFLVRSTISRDGRRIDGRWTMPGAPGGGYDYRLTRID
jgi:hypothetical protein